MDNTRIINNFELKEPSKCSLAQIKDKEEDAKAEDIEGDDLKPNEESWFTFLSNHDDQSKIDDEDQINEKDEV